MATEVKAVRISADEALAVQLAEYASRAAAAALRAGGYPRPTREQFQRIASAVAAEALAAALLVPGNLPGITDAQLDAAAELTGWAAVCEVLGPPPQAQ